MHHRKKHDKDNEKPLTLVENKFCYEDRVCEKGNLIVSTLSRPAIPLWVFYKF